MPAAVAAAIEVLNSKLECAQLVSTLVRVWARLWNVETKRYRVAFWGVGKAGVTCCGQVCWQCQTRTSNSARL
jgi:hypothetical protein